MHDKEIACLSYVIMDKAKNDFPSYFLLMNAGSKSFKFTRLQRFVGKWVDSIVRRDGKLNGGRGALSQPPQTGKTNTVTREYLSFIMGAIPGIQIAVTGHSTNLLFRFSNWIRDRVNTPLWTQLFDAKIKDGEDRVSEWAMDNGSRVMFRTVGQPLTGSHVDVLVIDDVYSGREQAEMPTQRERVKEWYMANCLTRISPNGSIICVNTRWHKEDLIGYLSSEDYVESVLDGGGSSKDLFKVINLPALCEDERTDPLGRKVGESIFPEYKSAAWFKRIRAQIDAYEWRTQYQGDPQIRTESDIDLKKIRYITMADVPEGIERLRGWDLAVSEEQMSDFTAGPLIAYDDETDTLYLLDMCRNKLSWPKNFKVITELARRDAETHGVTRMGVEAVAGFLAVFQQLRDSLLGEIQVRAQNPPKGGKLLRAQPWLNKIEAGRFCIVKAPWNKDFIAELQVFPAGAHDDQIDGISVAWERLVGRNRNGSDLESKKPQAEGKRPLGGSRPSGGPRP